MAELIEGLTYAPTGHQAEVASRLQKATGLQVIYIDTQNIHNYENQGMFGLKVPEGADPEKFKDAFAIARNATGITREQMPIRNTIKSGIRTDMQLFDYSNHGFFIGENDLTPDVLKRLEANSGAFHKLLPSQQHGEMTPLAPHGKPYQTIPTLVDSSSHAALSPIKTNTPAISI